MSKQTHIFATCSDLKTGLGKIDTDLGVRYVRCGMHHGRIFEQYSSLLAWDDLGGNTTGDHISGPNFLVVMKKCKVKVERRIPQLNRGFVSNIAAQQIFAVDSRGNISESSISLDDCLSGLEKASVKTNELEFEADVNFSVSQKINPDSITFQPGGIYKGERVLVCGHIGTISQSPASLSLYKHFVKTVTEGFEKIGSYRVGQEAARLMDEGYRMVTISINSPAAYDLRRSA